MDHEAVVRQQMTERYLLGELDSAARDEFEAHFFDCPDCARDVHAGALFVEQSKLVLAENSEPAALALPVKTPGPVTHGWINGGWINGLRLMLRPVLRPMFAMSVMAMLLAVVVYQNLVTYPQLQHAEQAMAMAMNSPHILPYASVHVGAYGSGPTVTIRPGQDFVLSVRIPPEGGYSHYLAELHNPEGKVVSSLEIPLASGQSPSGPDSSAPDDQQDQWTIQIPGANREAGSYNLVVHGVTAAGESKEVGQAAFELRIQK